MKTYVLRVSKYFPKTHNRAGQITGFVWEIQHIFGANKLHTIRKNYEYWKRIEKEVAEGKAIVSIRYWSGKPFRSKQVVIRDIKYIGVEKLEHPDNFIYAEIEGAKVDWEQVAENDGLSFEDFCEWFAVRQKEPMAVIHFTKFRYGGKNGNE